MEKQEYQTLYNREDSYWWYLGLRSLILSSFDKFIHKRDNLKVLDAGCGTGGILSALKVSFACGLDISEDAMKFCKSRKLNNLIRASICNIPFNNSSFDAIISLDVLYHLSVKNDIEALKEFYRVLRSGGILFLELPAYNFLRSIHDRAVHTRHRYTLKEIKQKVERTGFAIERITYRNTILLFLAVIKRLIGKASSRHKSKGEAVSDLTQLPDFVNKFFTQVLLIENRLILSGLKFPFGLSVFCIARKK